MQGHGASRPVAVELPAPCNIMQVPIFLRRRSGRAALVPVLMRSSSPNTSPGPKCLTEPRSSAFVSRRAAGRYLQAAATTDATAGARAKCLPTPFPPETMHAEPTCKSSGHDMTGSEQKLLFGVKITKLS